MVHFFITERGKGLTTMVRAEFRYTSMLWQFVLEQDAIRLVFLPTKSGKFYMSNQEEKQQDPERWDGGSSGIGIGGCTQDLSTIPSKTFRGGWQRCRHRIERIRTMVTMINTNNDEEPSGN